LKLLSAYVPKKDPTLNPTRRLLTRAKETRGLVSSLQARFPGKLAPRIISTCARNMGAHVPQAAMKHVKKWVLVSAHSSLAVNDGVLNGLFF
jgi:hypothetical protein